MLFIFPCRWIVHLGEHSMVRPLWLYLEAITHTTHCVYLFTYLTVIWPQLPTHPIVISSLLAPSTPPLLCHRWVSPWVNARQLLRSFCVYYPWIDACSCYKSNKTYYKCLSQSPPLPALAPVRLHWVLLHLFARVSSCRYYSDLSASRCASNLTNFAQIMRRPQMMTMTTTRTMAIPVPVPVPVSVLVQPCAQQKATKLLLH